MFEKGHLIKKKWCISWNTHWRFGVMYRPKLHICWPWFILDKELQSGAKITVEPGLHLMISLIVNLGSACFFTPAEMFWRMKKMANSLYGIGICFMYSHSQIQINCVYLVSITQHMFFMIQETQKQQSQWDQTPLDQFPNRSKCHESLPEVAIFGGKHVWLRRHRSGRNIGM